VASPFERDEISSSLLVYASEERPIRFQDVDAAGTIYYARMFEYFGDVYVRMLAEAGLDMPASLLQRDCASPLAHAEAQYLAPLVFGDRVTVKIVLARVGKTSTSYAYRVEKEGVLAAVGQTVHVWVDPKTFLAMPVPETLRRFLESRS
jgi:1,4-dihydroxy-2-naphthoyl-CoA hydrolase